MTTNTKPSTAKAKVEPQLQTPYLEPETDQLARSYLQKLIEVDEQKQQADSKFRSPCDKAKRKARKPKTGLNLAIGADLALTAVLTARALEQHPGLDTRLREGAVIVVRLGNDVNVECLRTVLSKCVFGGPAYHQYAYNSRLEDGYLEVESEKGSFRPSLLKDLSRAIGRGVPVVGLLANGQETLPQLLLDASECEIALGQPDASAVAIALEYATGQVFPVLTPEIAARVQLSVLVAAIRPGRKVEDACDLLIQLVEKRSKGPDLPTVRNEGPRLEDLHGFGAAKTWGLEAAADLQAYVKGEISWEDCDHRGLLLSGPPGVGKTLWARAFANTADLPLVVTSVADWHATMQLGHTLKAIRSCFAEARARRPSILFIDEIDGVASRLLLNDRHTEYYSQIINLVLEELQGASENNDGVIVIAATNLPQRIDPAILRSGRLDHHIAIAMPEFDDLKNILRYCIGNSDFDEDAISRMAAASLGSTGADIEAYVRRARSAARRKGETLNEAHVHAQIQSLHLCLSPDMVRRVAVHEAGHAAMYYMTGFGRVRHLTMTKDGGQVGIDDALTGLSNRDDLAKCMLAYLAGHAAEEIVLGTASIAYGNGGESDMKKATNLAISIQLLCEDRVGFAGSSDHALSVVSGMYEKVSARVRASLIKATEMLWTEQPLIHALADELQRLHYIDRAGFDAICAKHGTTHRHQAIPLKEVV